MIIDQNKRNIKLIKHKMYFCRICPSVTDAFDNINIKQYWIKKISIEHIIQIFRI